MLALLGVVVVAGGVAAAAALVVSASPSSSAGRPHHPSARAGSSGRATVSDATTPRPPTTGLAGAKAHVPLPVSSTVIDAGPTGAPVATPGAELATKVWFPRTRATAGHHGAHDHPGRYPLIVFSQGFEVAPERYQTLLVAWASAGFVVAAPTYPYTDGSPTPSDEADIVNHPADLRRVVGAVLEASARASSVLHGLVNAREIALVGHSDGGDVTLAVAANTCCRYLGVKAAVILSGAELTSFGGTYFAPAGKPYPPLLVVQGSADTVNVPACSAELYDDATSPKWYLDLLGAPHLAPYAGVSHYEQVVAHVTTDFFEAELSGHAAAPSGRAAALARMRAQGTVRGLAELRAGATVPAVAGACPGAP